MLSKEEIEAWVQGHYGDCMFNEDETDFESNCIACQKRELLMALLSEDLVYCDAIELLREQRLAKERGQNFLPEEL